MLKYIGYDELRCAVAAIRFHQGLVGRKGGGSLGLESLGDLLLGHLDGILVGCHPPGIQEDGPQRCSLRFPLRQEGWKEVDVPEGYRLLAGDRVGGIDEPQSCGQAA